MLVLDRQRCSACGLCMVRSRGYCLSPDSQGRPVVDSTVCNNCQKCIALCPQGAISQDGVPSQTLSLEGMDVLEAPRLEALMARRRSCKAFMDKPVPRHLLFRVAQAGAWAPDQNKNIGIVIVDNPKTLAAIDQTARGFFRRIYVLMFRIPPLAWILPRFAPLRTIRRKLEWDLIHRGRILKDGTPALVILHGPARVPVTQASGWQLVAAMVWMAQALDLGSCLMDSVRLPLEQDTRLKRRLGIRDNVLAVLALGFSGEKLVRIPRGWQPPIRFV